MEASSTFKPGGREANSQTRAKMPISRMAVKSMWVFQRETKGSSVFIRRKIYQNVKPESNVS
ncbi:MAG: hypothetical protein JETCAE01_23750 [Anaerolineaceae bacterium]|nr:MAG: hypothetical protein JETCAE01_23750 [Anaerolineaceae bacterium]